MRSAFTDATGSGFTTVLLLGGPVAVQARWSPGVGESAPGDHMIRAAKPADLETVRGFLREYAASLSFDLSFQDFDSELADPFGFYEAVLLAEDGCVALRRFDELACEMKRLYVRPVARGSGLGRRLAEAVITEARARGYSRMLLDTVPEMAAAQALYRSLGFREAGPYRHNPVPGAVFLELPL
jgi:putative acetyltransferase